jgi:hypothetical protein
MTNAMGSSIVLFYTVSMGGRECSLEDEEFPLRDEGAGLS